MANPFITDAHYDKEMACMTPYQALNNRNYRNEWMAAFIVVAETPEDIQKSIKFAKKHNIGVSVINTGHELLDRNAGPGPNTLMIRTTCFTDWKPNLALWQLLLYKQQKVAAPYKVVWFGLVII